MADDKITIEIDLDEGSVKSGFKAVEREGQNSAKNLSKDFTKSIDGLKIALVGLAGIVASVFASRKIIDAAAAQQQAVNDLNTSLRLAGTFSEETSKSLQQFASDLQTASTVGDETTLSLLALAQNFTTTSDQAQRLTEAAVNLSAATNLTLESAVINLGKTFAGLTGELGESVPALRGLTKEALQSGAAIDLVLQRFGGAAQAQLKTFNGQVKATENAYGDLLEVLGTFVIENTFVVDAIDKVRLKLISVTKELNTLAQNGGIEKATISFLNFGKAINNFVVLPIEFVSEATVAAFQNIRTGIQAIVALIARAAEGIALLLGPDSSTAQSLTAFRTQAEGLFVSLAEKAGTATSSIGNLNITESIDKFITDLQRASVASNNANKKISDGFDKIKTDTKETAEDISSTTKSIAQNTQNFLVGVTTATFASLGKNLVQSKNLFDGIGGQILSILGDFAIQIGIVVSGIGKAATAVAAALSNPFTGPAAIAAGLALIALGGALKALAGGVGSPSPTASNGGNLVGSQPIGATEDVTSIDPETDIEEKTRGNININVDGTVLDPKSVGLQIAEILKDVNDSNDLVTVNV